MKDENLNYITNANSYFAHAQEVSLKKALLYILWTKVDV